MEDARRERLGLLLEQALALSVEERAGFIEQASGDDAAVREELASLVAASEPSSRYFDALAEHVGPALAAAADLVDPTSGLESDGVGIGDVVSHYEIVERIGGGMGVVYRARDLRLGRPVALKFLPPALAADEQARERLYAEARAASALDHPNIGTVYEIGEADPGGLYIALAWYEGETLKETLRRGPLPVAEAVVLARQVTAALAAAHAAGIVHRDVKPSNIVRTRQGAAKLVDFGIAKVAGTEPTREGSTPGTVAYMSPEQTRGDKVDARTDVWSLGVVLYEMLAGRRPFRGENDATLIHAIRHDEPDALTSLRSDVPPAVAGIVGTCLAKDPSARYAQVDDLLAAFGAVDDAETDLSALPPEGVRRSESLTATAPEPKLSRRAFFVIGVGLAVLLVAGLAAWYLRGDAMERGVAAEVGSAVTPDLPVIAVFPFDNMSGSEESEYFSDGITEDILLQLSKIGDLRVISRQSVMRYKDADMAMSEIADELGASHVIEGSVRRAEDDVRITAQLIDARSDEHVWGRQYDRELSAEAIFDIQSEIAREIARELRATLSPELQGRLSSAATEVLTAYDYFLEGREYQRRGTREDYERAIAHFRQALVLDPDFALAHAELSFAYTALVGATAAPGHWLDSAEVAARTALDLDPLAAESHSALALFYWNSGQITEALDAYGRALELRPNDYDSLWGMAFAMWLRGELDEALRLARQAVTLDPGAVNGHALLGRCYLSLSWFEEAEGAYRRALRLQPDNPWAHQELSWTYVLQGEYVKAAEQLRTLGALRPASVDFLAGSGYLALLQGDYDAARRYFEQFLETHPEAEWLPLEDLGFIYARLGDTARAGELWRRAKTRAGARDQEYGDLYREPLNLGREAAARGERDEALQWLETAYERGWRGQLLIDIAVDPLLESLEDDPRFQELRSRILADVERMRLRARVAEAEGR